MGMGLQHLSDLYILGLQHHSHLWVQHLIVLYLVDAVLAREGPKAPQPCMLEHRHPPLPETERQAVRKIDCRVLQLHGSPRLREVP